MEELDYLRKLEKHGYKAYIVGGYVRDKLLNINSSDIDITTSAKPKTIREIFNIKCNDNLGSINIKTSSLNIDITTFRKESNYFGHRPKKVVYIKDLKKDLKRRDFTINTICIDKDGNIIDLLGGKKDLNNRLLRVVGNVKKKFTEDPLRMLRIIRLSIIYDLKINNNELIFILNNRKLFDKISFERKKEELSKILICSNVLEGLKLLKTFELEETLGIKIKDDVKKVHDLMGMWSQLEFSDNYNFSKLEKSRINNIRSIIKYNNIDNIILYKYGLYDTLVAGEILGYKKEEIDNIYKKMPIKDSADLKVDGNDIIKCLNINNSPKIKTIKDDIIDNILNNNLKNNKKEIINYIKKKWK